VLTEPGLSTIVTAVIGARKIFQRMTTYAKYTVAMTFRICFTFGLLTTIYNWRALLALHLKAQVSPLPCMGRCQGVLERHCACGPLQCATHA
jgi:magnesium-transporting ATPase (P-type)